jgi:cytochrome c oxidase cbb3-type subunit 3
MYANNCAVCHGAAGEGSRGVGAPSLNDKIWLYGGDRASLTETVTNAHAGVMPAWTGRLDPVTIKMLSAYVHSRGGGQDPAPAAAPAASPAGDVAQSAKANDDG